MEQKRYFKNREEWRSWLEKHYDSEKEVWLIYYKKHTGKPTISYNDAVEEALCFGWIDSIVRRIDEEKYAQKFTPRVNHAKWSESNRKRIKKLIKEGRMTEAGIAKWKPAVQKNENQPQQLIMPADFEQALAANRKAKENFENFAPGYRRNYIRWIIDAKKEETRKKRIKEAVSLIAKNTKALMK